MWTLASMQRPVSTPADLNPSADTLRTVASGHPDRLVSPPLLSKTALDCWTGRFKRAPGKTALRRHGQHATSQPATGLRFVHPDESQEIVPRGHAALVAQPRLTSPPCHEGLDSFGYQDYRLAPGLGTTTNAVVFSLGRSSPVLLRDTSSARCEKW